MSADRFISPCAPPEGYEREILTILAEEASEVIQRASKSLRFGISEVQPGQPHSNAYRLGMELGDFLETLDRAVAVGAVDLGGIEAGRAQKARQLAKYLQTAEPSHDR